MLLLLTFVLPMERNDILNNLYYLIWKAEFELRIELNHIFTLNAD